MYFCGDCVVSRAINILNERKNDTILITINLIPKAVSACRNRYWEYGIYRLHLGNKTIYMIGS